MGSWFCLQHVAFEGPAGIATALEERAVELHVVRLDLGDPLPAAVDVAGLVVMGGPMGAGEDVEHPWLPAERALIAEVVAADRPVLGVCLGAQLLAAALGAGVFRGPRGEVGAGAVELRPAASTDPLFAGLPDPLPVLHWHHDTFDLPAGAVLLASSERYAHQAFRVGRAYGLQFHVELGPDERGILLEHMNPARVPSSGDLGAIKEAGATLLRRFAVAATSA